MRHVDQAAQFADVAECSGFLQLVHHRDEERLLTMRAVQVAVLQAMALADEGWFMVGPTYPVTAKGGHLDANGYRWLGAQSHDRTLKRIQRAHVLVHASRMEGGAHVVIEALRSGTPVIASQIDGRKLGPLGTIRIQGLKGDPLEAASIADIALVDDEGVWLRAKDARIEWTPDSLFAGELEIQKINITTVDVLRAPHVTAPPEEGSAPDIGLSLDEVTIDDLHIAPSIIGSDAHYKIAGGASRRRDASGFARLVLSPLQGPNDRADITAEWAQIKAPPAPALKPVTIEPKTTALLMLDFMRQNCNKERRPRCVDSLPIAKAMLEKARAAGVPVVYSIIANTTPKDVWDEVAPAPGEPAVLSGVDKFFNTDLEKILKDKGVTTVITIGTAAHGAVLYTASGAALRGMNVIVPVDGVTAESQFIEQYTAVHLTSAPGISAKVTLTRSDLMKF